MSTAAKWATSVKVRSKTAPRAKGAVPVTNEHAKWRKRRLLSLTSEQFVKMKDATTNYRKLRQQLKQIEMLSRSIIFEDAPHRGRRKRLSRKVLGTK